MLNVPNVKTALSAILATAILAWCSDAAARKPVSALVARGVAKAEPVRPSRVVRTVNFIRASANLPALRRASPKVRTAYRKARKQAAIGVFPHAVVTFLGGLGWISTIRMDSKFGAAVTGLATMLGAGAGYGIYRADLTYDTIKAAIHDPKARAKLSPGARSWIKGELRINLKHAKARRDGQYAWRNELEQALKLLEQP